VSLKHYPRHLIDQVMHRVHSLAGFVVHEGGLRRSFERVLTRRLAERKEGALKYLQALLTEEAPLAELIEELTVGETYFFRHPSQWRLFEHHLLPELLKSPSTIRLWSSACSTGEEAYTIAIIVSRLLPSAERGRVQILASDLNTASLARAEAGVYSRRAVRYVSQADMKQYFVAREDGSCLVREELKRLVNFRRLNLLDLGRSRGQEPAALDVIFCRNVLIYFDLAVGQRVIEGLTRALRPGGYLILGPSEHSQGRPAALARCQFKEGLVYQRRDDAHSAGPARSDARPAARTVRLAQTSSEIPDLPRPAPSRAASGLAREAWQHAEREQFAEALEAAQRALSLDPLDCSLYLLMGIGSDRLGNRVDAAGWFRKALYLDPRHLLSRFYLANACRGLGEHEAADREYRTLLRYLHGRPAEELVEADKGWTAEALRAVCEKAIDRLPQPVMEELA
jgi:chemotaxis protein methyltransferase CheR